MTPAEETAALAKDATVTFSGSYLVATGTIEIAPSLGSAGWSLSGPDSYSNSGTGSATLPDVAIGEYTITWAAVTSYFTPSPETATLASEATLTFSATYVSSLGSVEFTDRAAWEAAVGSAPTLTDDYNDVTVDVHPTGGQIARSGYTLSEVYWIDAVPFIDIATRPMSVNGTTDVLPKTSLFVITFDEPTHTFGGDWACGGGSSGWYFEYTTDAGDNGGFNLPITPSVGEFRGFIAANPFTTITFTSTGHWRVMDDLASHPGVSLELVREGGEVEVRRD